MDFKIKKDLKDFLALRSVSMKELAAKMGKSEKTLYNWIKSDKPFSREAVESFYEISYKAGVRFNRLKEQLYRENLASADTEILFHGSKSGISGDINLSKARSNNDFGKGFYCGQTLKQAAMFVSSFADSCVYAFNFDTNGLNGIRYFVDIDWMLTIATYRGRLQNFTYSKILSNLVAKAEAADYIIAPIADNRMYDLIDQFIFGEITDIQCQHCLSATDLGYQIVFKSEKALQQLTMLEKLYLSASEKHDYQVEQKKTSDLGRDKVKLAKKLYRNQGKYIEEILDDQL